jgi:hypothetical protein
MLSFIFSFLKSGTFLFLLNDYLKRHYPEQYKETLLTISFNVVCLYSRIEIECKKKYRLTLDYIKKSPTGLLILNFLSKNISHASFEVIKNSKHIETVNPSSMTKETVEELVKELVKDNDFLIYSDKVDSNNEKNCVNKRLIYGDTSVNRVSHETLICQPSNVQFILVEIRCGENVCKINLKDKNCNYYVVGNIFTKSFFMYYLNKFYSRIFESLILNTDCELSLKLIDHNVSVIEIDMNEKFEYIKLEKESYTIQR